MKNSQNKNLGLPRASILRGKVNFQRIFQQGSVYRAPSVDLRYIIFPESEQPECLVAFITGRRLGKAVHRNKIRRQLREAYRLHAQPLQTACLDTQSSVHLALIAKKAPTTYADIERDVVFLLSKVTRNLAQRS